MKSNQIIQFAFYDYYDQYIQIGKSSIGSIGGFALGDESVKYEDIIHSIEITDDFLRRIILTYNSNQTKFGIDFQLSKEMLDELDSIIFERHVLTKLITSKISKVDGATDENDLIFLDRLAVICSMLEKQDYVDSCRITWADTIKGNTDGKNKYEEDEER